MFTVRSYVVRVYFLMVLSVPACVFAQDCQSLLGTWQNELGSQLVIDSIATGGEISGEYRSSSGVDGKVFQLIGIRQ